MEDAEFLHQKERMYPCLVAFALAKQLRPSQRQEICARNAELLSPCSSHARTGVQSLECHGAGVVRDRRHHNVRDGKGVL